MKEIKLALSYDDVLLVPKRSPLKSRKDVNTSGKLTTNIILKTPIVSANMDTVTEAKMAITMARAGGIGFIHRFLTIAQQVKEVEKVKRAENIIIENPYTISKDQTIGDIRELRENLGVSGFLVTEGTRLIGVLTNRDLLFRSDSEKIEECMTPRGKLITAKEGISINDAKKILQENRVEKLPIIDWEDNLKGLITTTDLRHVDRYPDATKDSRGRLRVGAAVGVKPGFLERTEALINAGVDILVLDIAHGHSDFAIESLIKIKSKFPGIPIVAGNVATSEGAEDLIKAGADCIKVGVGPGAMCTTRIVTGSGYPQLSAVMNAVEVARKYGIPICADGGIKNSGDLSKALAAGADTVMIGTMFAGTDESPGRPITKGGMKYKICRGMASYDANVDRAIKTSDKDVDESLFDEIVPEGVKTIVPYRGAMQETLTQLIGGLRSSLSYCGSHNLDEMHTNSEFIRMTSSGMRESKPHGDNG
jgi:IMP dehydrogenase